MHSPHQLTAKIQDLLQETEEANKDFARRIEAILGKSQKTIQTLNSLKRDLARTEEEIINSLSQNQTS